MPDSPVERARRIAAEVLIPAAEATDQADLVPTTHLARLADAGLFAVYGPATHGGTPAPGPQVRAVHRVLGGACGVTYFVWAQHQGPVMLLASSPNAELRDRWLPRLCRGEVVGGTAFAHLRRPGPPAVLATPSDGGWRLDGEAPWASSWGRAGVYSVAAFTPDGDVLWVLVEGHPQPGLSASAPLALAVMQATGTVRLRFERFEVPADQVILQLPPDLWWAIDDGISARLNPAVLGVADRALALLGERTAEERGAGVDLGEALGAELGACATRNEALAADADAGSVDLDALADGRAWGIDLAQRAALALLTATGGRGVELASPPQRLVREAAFYAIQAQTRPGRDASLRRAAQAGSAPEEGPPPATEASVAVIGG